MSKRNYNEISAKPAVEEETLANTEIEAPYNDEPKIETIGVVANCNKLNIREKPDIKSEVVCEVRIGSELKIDMDESTDGWFKVCTAAGSEGFCMREYVNEQHTDIN